MKIENIGYLLYKEIGVTFGCFTCFCPKNLLISIRYKEGYLLFLRVFIDYYVKSTTYKIKTKKAKTKCKRHANIGHHK